VKKLLNRKKLIIQILLLIVVFSNFSFSFAFWASSVLNNQSEAESLVEIGQWDFEDTALVVATFRLDYEDVLSLTPETVSINDKTNVEEALSAYGILSEEAKIELSVEKDLLDSLLIEIIQFENSVFLDFESTPFDNGLTGTVVIDGRTWYGNDIFIAGDAQYDVWIGVRSLALRQNAYFESRDFFINGIDQITLYHGALNFNNGNNFQFRIEYELASNPGVWVILENGGIDLIIDVVSGNPLTFTTIDVSITEAVNIRFFPILSATGDYINLDDIRIFENVVASDLEAITFRTVYQALLALDVEDIVLSNQSAILSALNAYDLLSIDAQTELSPEKALLDSFNDRIILLEAIFEAEQAVILAESTNEQTDLDQAQAFVSALPNGTIQDDLQFRIDQVQTIINQVALFRSDYSAVLSLTVGTVTPSDQTAVEAALSAFAGLSQAVQDELALEEALLISLLEEINNQIPTATQVADFRADYAYVLGLTTGTVTIGDQAQVDLAILAYNTLSAAAKLELEPEKALLDSLALDIDILIATEAVNVAETSFLQSDFNAAQVLVNALPSSVAKSALQARLDNVQEVINSVNDYRILYEDVLSLTPETVSINDKTNVEEALSAYGILSEEAKIELSVEKDLLDSLLIEIIQFENSVFLDFESTPFDNGLTGTVVIDGRTWYGNDIFIAGDAQYDVWIGVRSLALRQNAYFESRDFFINGIDQITLYHGALNFNNGNNFQFRIEYELASNPGVWVILENGGIDLIIDVVSGNPLTFTTIDVSITEAVNIRFFPILSATGDYINLDDIRIFENVVASDLEAITFRTVYQALLALDVEDIVLSNQSAILSALNAYDLLSIDAQTELSPEKALLDSFNDRIILLEAIFEAEQAVILAESTNEQTDLDQAQAFVSALPNGTIQDDLQFRIDQVQIIINQVALFRSDYSAVLSLTVGTVTPSDQTAVEAALSAFAGLSQAVQDELALEEALLISLLEEINNQIPTATQVADFRADYAYVLGLTTGTVTIGDQAQVDLAILAYSTLSAAAKLELEPEKALLDSLALDIDILIATEAVNVAETSFLQSDFNAAQVLVNALPSSVAKSALEQRLIDLQDDINQLAANQVDALILALPTEGNLTLTDENDVIAARFAYDALTSIQQALVQNESLLISLEEVMIFLITAENAVQTAEASQLQVDVNQAFNFVSFLPEGNAKQALTARLNAVQDIIDVNAAETLILNYFATNPVFVTNLNNNTLKQTNFLTQANNVVSGLGVTITVQSSNRIDRNNTIYTISIVKNGASVVTEVSVNFLRN
jgi:hypothetical protein